MTGLIDRDSDHRYAPVHYKYYQLQRRDFLVLYVRVQSSLWHVRITAHDPQHPLEETEAPSGGGKLRMEVPNPPLLLVAVHNLYHTFP